MLISGDRNKFRRRVTELEPTNPPIIFTPAERLLIAGQIVANEIEKALKDGEVTTWEAVKIGFSILRGIISAVKK